MTALQISERRHHEVMERTISIFKEILAREQYDMRDDKFRPEKDTKATIQAIIIQAVQGLVREVTQQGKFYYS